MRLAPGTVVPPPPVAETGPPLVVVTRTRIRDLSAQVLGIEGDWRPLAAEAGLARAEARRAAEALVDTAAARSAVAAAVRAAAKEAGTEPKRLTRAERFPAWRVVKPPPKGAD